MTDTSNHSERHGRWHVNRRLLPMKIHFFLFFGSFAGIVPACILSCRRIGMSMSDIGTLYATLPFLQFVSKPIFGGIADKYRRHKTAFLASIFCMGVFMFSIKFIPLPPDDIQMVDWNPHDEATFECRRHPESPDSGIMLLTICDRNASNSHFQVLSSMTIVCNVSCDTSDLPDIATVFCDKDNVDCLAIDRYSFNEVPKTRQHSTAHFSAFRNLTMPTSNVSGSAPTDNNTSCLTMPIASVTIIPNAGTFMNSTTVNSCHFPQDTDISIGCKATCTAAVRPSLYAVVRQDTTLQYVWMWIALILAMCSYGVLISMSDTIIIHLLGDRPEDFGLTRLFGSLGWGLMAPIVGFIIDKVSERLPEKDYSPGFYLWGSFMLVDFLVNIPTKVNIPEKSKELFRDVVGLFRRPTVILMACTVFANGIVTGFTWTFLVVYLEQLSGNLQLLIGLNYAVECFASEIPFFGISGWFMSKVGHSYAMTISLFVSGLKSFLYSLLVNPWYVLGVALFHGFTYGLLYASMATYVGEIAPPGTGATLQGIFQGIFEGIGVAVGNLVGGYVYENVGGHRAFFLFGVTTMAASVVHFVISRILDRIGRRRSRPSLDLKIQLPPTGPETPA